MADETSPAIRRIGFWTSRTRPDLPHPSQFVDETWDPEERRVVADYLDSGLRVLTWRGWSHCRMCDCDQNGHSDFTDGTYLWPEGLGHYVREHGVRLPQEFAEHMDAIEARCAPDHLDDSWWAAQVPRR